MIKTKNKTVQIRVRRAEKRKMQETAAALGLSLSAWIRTVVSAAAKEKR